MLPTTTPNQELPPIEFHTYSVDIVLRIHKQSRDGYELHVQIGDMEPRFIDIDVTPDDLREWNRNFQHALNKVVQQGNNFNQMDANEVENTVLDLAEAGHTVYVRLFKNTGIGDLIAQYMEMSGRSNLLLQVVSESFFLPWDLIYPLNLATEPIDLEAFWGIQHVIYRLIPQRLTKSNFVSSEVAYDGCLLLGLLSCLELDYVDQEVRFLETLEEQQHIRMSKLRALDPKKKRSEFRELKAFLHNPFDFLHLACHAKLALDHNAESYFLLSDQFHVYLPDLHAYELEVMGFPLVFLNACTTGNLNPLHASTFVSFFMQHDIRGVIATECEVSDKFAAIFSQALYELLIKGEYLGNALISARRTFLRKEGSLGGLAYSLYARPTIRFLRTPTP